MKSSHINIKTFCISDLRGKYRKSVTTCYKDLNRKCLACPAGTAMTISSTRLGGVPQSPGKNAKPCPKGNPLVTSSRILLTIDPQPADCPLFCLGGQSSFQTGQSHQPAVVVARLSCGSG